jgi:hypothetical protein
MINDLNESGNKTITWSAPHIPAKKNWLKVAGENTDNEKTA